ncbi:hypothetical protein V2G26_004426 [Clonostachys chloroleuca]
MPIPRAPGAQVLINAYLKAASWIYHWIVTRSVSIPDTRANEQPFPSQPAPKRRYGRGIVALLLCPIIIGNGRTWAASSLEDSTAYVIFSVPHTNSMKNGPISFKHVPSFNAPRCHATLLALEDCLRRVPNAKIATPFDSHRSCSQVKCLAIEVGVDWAQGILMNNQHRWPTT